MSISSAFRSVSVGTPQRLVRLHQEIVGDVERLSRKLVSDEMGFPSMRNPQFAGWFIYFVKNGKSHESGCWLGGSPMTQETTKYASIIRY